MSKEVTLADLGRQKMVTETTKAPSVNNESNLKPMSLNDIANAMEELHPEEVAAKKASEEKVNSELINDAFSSLEATIERKKQEAENFVEMVREAVEEQKFEEVTVEEEVLPIDDDVMNLDDILNDLEEEDEDEKKEVKIVEKINIPTSTPVETTETPKPIKKKQLKKVVEEDEEDDDDFDEYQSMLDDLENSDVFDGLEEEDEEDEEELKERYRNSVSSIVISKKPIDFSEYKIRQTPISASKLLNDKDINNYKGKADWALCHTGRNMRFVECDGPELDVLRRTLASSSNLNGVVASIKFVYNHIEDANKPTFETWCKTIRTEDIESLYFGLYLATYASSNLIKVDHLKSDYENGCDKSSILDIDPYKMVKYKNDEVKEKFNSIRLSDSTTNDFVLESDMLQISDDYVISFTKGTLYTTFIQYSTLTVAVTEKYSDLLTTMAYINGFYKIDRETKELIPIIIKEYNGNMNKTVMSKLKVYVKILRSLNPDQYSFLTSKLNDIIEDPDISYVIPEVTCPECGETIKETPIVSMLSILFTRVQLAQLKNL